jgi:hypothetical protein
MNETPKGFHGKVGKSNDGTKRIREKPGERIKAPSRSNPRPYAFLRNNRYLTMRVVAGEARCEYTDLPITVEAPSYHTIAETSDDEITGDPNEAACDELFRISDFLSAAVAKC